MDHPLVCRGARYQPVSTQKARALASTRTYTGSRLLVQARDQGTCIRCGGLGAQVHHRRPRKAGGSSGCWWINLPANLVCLCLTCHMDVESHRSDAVMDGYIVVGNQEACEMMVRRFGEFVLLDNDGGYRTLIPHTRSG